MRVMSKLALAGIALASMATAAHAQPLPLGAPANVQVDISAIQPASCAFDQGLVQVRLDNLNRVFTQDLSYTCNYASAGLNVYLQSKNGALVSGEGDAARKASYNINFASSIAGDGSNWYPSENIDGTPQQGLIAPAAAGQPAVVKLGVFLRDYLKEAGVYADTVSITLAP